VRLALVAVVAIGVGVRVPTLDQPLLETGHSWRQTQTAWTARIFHEDGINLLGPEVPVLGPPWQLPFEFPLFQAIAAVAMNSGMDEETSLRLTGLLSFALTGAMVWFLSRRLVGEAGATAALAAFTFSPLGLLWSRTAMIEYLATAGAVGFAWAALSWRDSGSSRAYFAAIALGSAACLVKVTTGAFWVLAFALVATRRQGRFNPTALGMAATPLAIGAAWTQYSDLVKGATAATAGLTSAGTVEWIFGSLAQRLEPATWASIGASLVILAGLAVVPICVVVVSGRVRAEPAWGALVVVAVLPPLVLTNLYAEHDYYAMAVSPAIAVIIGGCLALLWRDGLRGRLVAGELVAIAIGALVVTSGYWTAMFGPAVDPERVLPNAAVIAGATQPEDLVVIIGREWNPALFYYADRRGVGLPPEAQPGQVAALRRSGYVVFDCPVDGSCALRP
jgi:hypothetical protein